MIGIYIRVSSEEQAVNGYSIQSQIDACVKKCNNYDHKTYVDDGVSGELLWERPALSNLREDIEDGIIDKVVCFDPDRLARKLVNQLIIDEFFSKNNIDIEYVNGDYADSPEGKLFYSLRGAVSEFEKAKIRERTTRGALQKMKEGKILRYDSLNGYDSNGDGGYNINEEEAKIIQMIFDMFTKDRYSYHKIVRTLTEKGYKTKRGGKWVRHTVKYILSNPVYKGTKIQNRYNASGVHLNKYKEKSERVKRTFKDEEDWVITGVPQIISEEQFELAQTLMENIKSVSSAKRSNSYMLSGILKCGVCGNTMVGHASSRYVTKKGEEKINMSYTCRKKEGGKKSGCGRYITIKKLEPYVWEYVTKFLNGEIKIEAPSLARELEEMKNISGKLEKAQNGRKRLIKMVAMNEEITLEDIQNEIVELKREEEKLKSRKIELEKLIKKPKINDPGIFRQAKEMLDSKTEFGFEDRREIIHLVLKKIHVYENLELSIEFH